MIRTLIRLTLREIKEIAENSKGSNVSYRPSKISEKIMRENSIKNSMIVRQVVKHVFEELCKYLNCEKRSTSRGVVYEFKREDILNMNIEDLEDKILL